MNRLDATLQGQCPTVMVPHYESLTPLAAPGHRYLAAADGVYVEVRRTWLYGIFPVGSRFRLPYGPIQPVCNFILRTDAMRGMLRGFVAKAIADLPLETALWYMMDIDRLSVQPWDCPAHHRSADHISYERPPASMSTVPVMDCHSHGNAPAFWSPTDNKDDLDDLKLAIVVGGVNTSRPSICMRLVGTPLESPIDFSEFAASLL